MAQKPNIPSQYLPQPCGSSPRLTVFTNSPNFMYLLFTFDEPKRKPRFKTIRGLTYECGRQWHLPNAVCIPQMNIPTKNYHVFPLPTAALGTCGWYAISDACRAYEATSFSPPIKYCYVACPPGGGFCQMQRVPSTGLGADFGIPYRDVIAGNSNVRVNDLAMKALVDGDYAVTATAVVRADPNGIATYTGEIYIENLNTNEEFGHATFTTNPDQEIAIATSASLWMDANDWCEIKVRRTSASGLCQLPASLNATSQWSITPL